MAADCDASQCGRIRRSTAASLDQLTVIRKEAQSPRVPLTAVRMGLNQGPSAALCGVRIAPNR
jgi:hypothetical protein